MNRISALSFVLSLFLFCVVSPGHAEPMPKHLQKNNAQVDWKSKSDVFWEEVLSKEAYRVCRESGTERPFSSKLHDNKKTGVYICSSCGKHLFSSQQKFDSGTGWPSFTAPASLDAVELREDNSFFMNRTEVVCSRCGAHLGHVFDDGPAPEHKRYCINGVCLFFIEIMESQ